MGWGRGGAGGLGGNYYRFTTVRFAAFLKEPECVVLRLVCLLLLFFF